jgi:sugar/nucleoside kinase (ribokinase family)
VEVEAVPARGEDTLARDFTQTVGGGFAVVAAAARSGMPTALAGVLGDDAVADAGCRPVAAEGVELLFPKPRAGGSGVCLVLVATRTRTV